MSFTENDRNFRSESGKTFPNAASPAFDSVAFQEAIADALRRDFGGSTAAVKRVARLVRANERGVRNWFDAKNGPSGEHLVMLMRQSPAVVEAVLTMSGQSGLMRAKLVADAKERISQILTLLDGITSA
jgi:hypothetical protein